jgi:hypothetical protein
MALRTQRLSFNTYRLAMRSSFERLDIEISGRSD